MLVDYNYPLIISVRIINSAKCEVHIIIQFLRVKTHSTTKIHWQIYYFYGSEVKVTLKSDSEAVYLKTEMNMHNEKFSGHLSVIIDDFIGNVNGKVMKTITLQFDNYLYLSKCFVIIFDVFV